MNMNRKQKNSLLFAFAATIALGTDQKIQAMEQNMILPGSVVDENGISFQDIQDKLFIAIQAYDYSSISRLAKNNHKALEDFLSANREEASDYLKFTIKSLDTFDEQIAIEEKEECESKQIGKTTDRTQQKREWRTLQLNSLLIAELLIKNGAPEEELEADLQKKLNKFRYHSQIKKVRFNI